MGKSSRLTHRFFKSDLNRALISSSVSLSLSESSCIRIASATATFHTFKLSFFRFFFASGGCRSGRVPHGRDCGSLCLAPPCGGSLPSGRPSGTKLRWPIFSCLWASMRPRVVRRHWQCRISRLSGRFAGSVGDFRNYKCGNFFPK